MLEKYLEILSEVMEEKGYTEWYELFDSEDFDIVADRCFSLEGFDLKIYVDWVAEMSGDL